MARQMKDSGIEWIGEIPETWDLVQLKRFVTVNNGREIEVEVDDTAEGAIGVYGSGGVFKYTDRYMHDGVAVMFGRKGTLGKPLYVDNKFWVVDTMYYLTYTEALHPKYNYYQLMVFDWNPHITQTALPSVVASQIVAKHFPIPDVKEQHRIAAFLDRKCAEIDAVIERTKATIDEYKKLKQAVITEAVTKGVRGPRPMKDSGIEWIGEIPEGWATVQLKRLARIATGSTPPKNEESTFYSQDSGCLWIKAEDLGTSNNIETTTEYLTEAGKREGRIFPPCTVYVCCIASVGKVGYCVTEASCNQQINGLIFENAHWKYGFYLSLAQEEEYLLNASGNVMKILNTDKQSRLMCPCPPVEEQVEIATFLDGKCAALDTIIAKKTALLTELETYKKSLIYEYVTGKKEV